MIRGSVLLLIALCIAMVTAQTTTPVLLFSQSKYVFFVLTFLNLYLFPSLIMINNNHLFDHCYKSKTVYLTIFFLFYFYFNNDNYNFHNINTSSQYQHNLTIDSITLFES